MKAKEYLGLITIVAGAIATTYIVKRVFFSDEKKSNFRGGIGKRPKLVAKDMCWCVDAEGGRGYIGWCPCKKGFEEVQREENKK